MNIVKPIKIVGSGIYLPQKVSSQEIEKKYNIPIGYSVKYSGVDHRHQVTFESNGYMGARAAENALIDSNLKIEEIDLLISASATFDYPLPNKSSVILSEIKTGNTDHLTSFDIDTTCLSFVSAFEVAAKLLDGKQYKKVLIVSSEISSKGLNPTHAESLTLFGDGAAAFILTYDESYNGGFIKSKFRTYKDGLNYTIIKGGGNKYHFKDNPYDVALHSFAMDGFKLLKLAKTKLPDFMHEFLNDLNMKMEDVDVIIPHQASMVGLSLLKHTLTFRKNQIVENIGTHGNCIAASIPILLHQSIKNGSIKRGYTCLLIGTSAGVSLGALVFKY